MAIAQAWRIPRSTSASATARCRVGPSPGGGSSSSVGDSSSAAGVGALGCELSTNGTPIAAPSPVRTATSTTHTRREGRRAWRPPTLDASGGSGVSSHESSAITAGLERTTSMERRGASTTAVPGVSGTSDASATSGRDTTCAAPTARGGGGSGGSAPGTGHGAMTGMILVTALSTRNSGVERCSGTEVSASRSGLGAVVRLGAVVWLGLFGAAHAATTHPSRRVGHDPSACPRPRTLQSMCVIRLTLSL